MIKEQICAAIGVVGGFIAAVLGGWDTGLQTLVLFMCIDYITGLIVAGIFHNSTKTEVEKGSEKAKCIVAIIGSTTGIQCQDALMEQQIQEYEKSITEQYICTPLGGTNGST